MGNQCNSKTKGKETSSLVRQKSNQNQNQTTVPLKFIIEIDKIKCKNLTNVKIYCFVFLLNT